MPTAPFLAPARDDSYNHGRAKGGGVTFHTVPGVTYASSTAVSFTAASDYYSPFFVRTPIRVDRLTCEVTSGASGNLRMGVYRADKDQQPIGAPLVDSGNIAITVALKTFTPGTPLYFQPGRYLSVLALDTTSTLRGVKGTVRDGPIMENIGAIAMPTQLSVGRAYAAFPTPGTAWTDVVASSTPMIHPILFRILMP